MFRFKKINLIYGNLNVCGVPPLYSQRGDEGEFAVAQLNSPNPSLYKRGENGTTEQVAKLELFNYACVLMVSMVLAFVCGCSAGPKYVKPVTEVPKSYKETANWKEAQPQENIARGEWWKVYNDEGLNRLEEQVDVSNQNIAAAEAQFQEARALMSGAKAGYYPVISAGASSMQTSTGAFKNTVTNNTASVNLSWEIDIWGRVRRNVESNRANVQATAADLESLRLSLHATLAQDYFLAVAGYAKADHGRYYRRI